MEQLIKRLYLIPLLIVLSVFLYISNYKVLNDDLEVYFLDVGQGDSMLIKTPFGKHILIDTGRGRVTSSRINEVNKNIKNIDLLFLTHNDSDHVGGLKTIFEHFEVHSVVVSNVDEEIMELIKKEESKLLIVEKPIELSFGNIYFDILWPQEKGIKNDNESSIVMMMEYLNSKFYFGGDIGENVEKELVKNYDLNVDVLKLSHHGSCKSTPHELIRESSPEVAIVSASGTNGYGHPCKSLVDKLKNLDIDVLETSKEGTIMFKVTKNGVFYIFNQTDV